MAEILEQLNTYIPVHESDDEDIDDKVLPRLLFGDQLTVARARGSAVLRQTHTTSLSRLEGFTPCIADWHARMCLLTVCAES